MSVKISERQWNERRRRWPRKMVIEKARPIRTRRTGRRSATVEHTRPKVLSAATSAVRPLEAVRHKLTKAMADRDGGLILMPET